MDVGALIDWPSAAIVFGGTGIATMLRSGRVDMLACLQLLRGLCRPAFNLRKERAWLAPGVTAIQRSGIYRARLPVHPDPDLKAVLAALVRHRSLAAMTDTHRQSRSRRLELRQRGLRLLHHGGELAPVFGLAGTLIALSQPGDAAASSAALPTAVAAAVLTTLYGLLLAHLVLLPLARVLERRGEREEAARQALIGWLLEQLRDTVLEPAPAPAVRRTAAPPLERVA